MERRTSCLGTQVPILRTEERIHIDRVGLKAFRKALNWKSTPFVKLGIATYLHTAYPKKVHADELIDWCWALDPEGGPVNPLMALRRAIFLVRKAGIPVISTGQRRYQMSYEDVKKTIDEAVDAYRKIASDNQISVEYKQRVKEEAVAKIKKLGFTTADAERWIRPVKKR